MAYILLGATYQEKDKSEAVVYLKKALECSEDCKLLALQGLSNCVKPDELPDILTQLLDLTPEKYLDIYVKLNNLISTASLHSKLIEVYSKEIKVDNEDRKYQALKNLLELFLKNRELALNEHKHEFLECLEIGFRDKEHVHHMDICRDYFKLLYQSKRYEELTKSAEEMSLVYPKSPVPLEWICKIYIENENFNINLHLKSNFGIYVERLLELNSTSILGMMASSMIKFGIGDLPLARDVLIKVNQHQPNWTPCLKKLAKVHQKLKAHLLAEIVLRSIRDSDIDLAEALIEQEVEEKINEGLNLLATINEFDNPKSLDLVARAQIYLKNFDNAEKLIEKMKLKNLETRIVEAKLKRYQGNFSQIIDILKEFEDHEAFLELGIAFFMMKNFDESLLNLLKATKLDKDNSKCFYWLGEIYLAIGDDLRSQKCFEKCLNLDPQNEKAITILSAVYRKNNNWDSNLSMLENSVKFVEGHHQKSAFFQLGLHHLGQQSYDNAITAFRNSLKYDTSNSKCWESLADAYYGRGSYSSALKVFEKSVELDNGNIYAKLQIAKIKFILQQYRESITDYKDILTKIPHYIPALFGVAESNFGRALYLHENHRSGRARDHFHESLIYLQIALKIEPKFISLWRMLGNVLDRVASLPDDHRHMTVPGELICETESRKLKEDELMSLAAKCYSRCLKINNDDEYVWFDLVVNMYTRSMRYGKANELLPQAFEAAKYVVKLSPSKWQNWNLLGIICATKEINDASLAQHCFVKAIELDKKTFTSWSNLGIFYLMHSNIPLANKAFSRAQQADTTFLQAWIGQGIIAEIIGERDEAMDIFRHCTQLGFHYESSLSYANYVCSILDNPNYGKSTKYEYAIDKMFAIPLALDNINWHTLFEADSTFEAWTYVGYLSRRQKLWNRAIQAYEQAVKLSEGVKKDQTLTDLGFCYLKVGRHEEAAKSFGDVKEATFVSTIGLALAFYKGKQFEECYEIYQKAIELMTTSDDEKAVVLVAMASMVYAFQGLDDAKMVLFQCIGLPSPPIEGLLSLCAISLIHQDKQLSELVIKELKKFEHDQEHVADVALMIAQFYIQNVSYFN
jgi:superkiller protein 3